MIKTFREVQKLAKIYGVASNQHPFNWRNNLAIFILCFGLISNGAYILNEAKSFQQYADAIFMAVALTGDMLVLTFLIVKMRLFFDYIHEEERMINESEKFLAMN